MKQVEFVGRIVRQTYSSENYKMYACDVDREKYPDIKFTLYGNKKGYSSLCNNVQYRKTEVDRFQSFVRQDSVPLRNGHRGGNSVRYKTSRRSKRS